MSSLRYYQGLRHPHGGGLTAERQQFREELRLQAAERFARGEASSVIARDLRVSVRSVQRLRQAWEEGGPRAPSGASPPRAGTRPCVRGWPRPRRWWPRGRWSRRWPRHSSRGRDARPGETTHAAS
ncbi:helix-turn-helix domain-containing protein [Streptomyces sp. NPDC056227]|uniref:helix-turn-helix domain-containing protein n=1 Tax=Streptomyces sp. NPDC056227 TaxID=3345753 RepID=UPI0035E29F6A